jgi:hypothetical protein
VGVEEEPLSKRHEKEKREGGDAKEGGKMYEK